MNPAYPMASLYVGDLAIDVTEHILLEKFSTVGPVLSIRVCRDAETKRSLGYAHVNYKYHSDAEKALAMNMDVINGRPCRIMWPQREPPQTQRRSGAGNIFIKNLDKAINDSALYDTFSAFGNILSCKVVTDEHGNSKGYGYVNFETKESAEMAIEKVNGMVFNDKKILVEMYLTNPEYEKQLSDRFTNVYVKNFGEDFAETELRDLFLPFGNIVSQRIMQDHEGRGRGFGFVNFDSHESAAQAVKELNGKTTRNGKQLYCNCAQKKGSQLSELKYNFDTMKLESTSRYQGMNLYVKNLDDEIDDERLYKEFSKFGTITSAKVMTHPNGESKGFGFVCFSSVEEATKAVTEMSGRIIIAKPLFVAPAQQKEERKAQLASQWRMPQQGGAGVRLPANRLNPAAAMFPPGFYPVAQQTQPPMYYPPAMIQQMRPSWQQGPVVNQAGGWVGEQDKGNRPSMQH